MVHIMEHIMERKQVLYNKDYKFNTFIFISYNLKN
jgi:hypothetical protein